MKTIKENFGLCLSCMEEHRTSTIEVEETNIFKGETVQFLAKYVYCENTDEYYETEELISQNDISLKNAYRKKLGLLASNEIITIRQKYGITQSDLALLLGWGEKTITRYEGHQVQNVAHDSILRKIEGDPEWYLELLNTFKEKCSESSYKKYHETALKLFEEQKDKYLRKSILGAYARFEVPDGRNGFTKLNLDKIVDTIRYFSNSNKVKSLYKVKLMKMLWYSDALSYKTTDRSITGLVYKALPMGAVPIAYDLIIDLKGINYEEVDFDEGTGYHFIPDENGIYPSLSDKDFDILDKIIDRFGNLNKKGIVDSMHKERAYIETAAYDIIQYKYAKSLSI